MAIRVWINGAVVGEEAARVSVFDRGFLYGDSVYEVMRTSGGVAVDLDAHLARLARSADSLMLPAVDRAALARAVRVTLTAAGNPESYVRVIVTRGAGEIGLDLALAVDPLAVVIVKPLGGPTEAMVRDGVALQIVGVQRTSRRAVDPGVKSGNYLNNILALAEARRAGAHEAVMCDASGEVAEGSSSNVFVVRAGEVITPPVEVGLLPGITRERILCLARARPAEGGGPITIREGSLAPDDLRRADEVFITSSVRGVLPAVRVDGVPIGDGRPGPVTRRVMAMYAEFLARVARDGA